MESLEKPMTICNRHVAQFTNRMCAQKCNFAPKAYIIGAFSVSHDMRNCDIFNSQRGHKKPEVQSMNTISVIPLNATRKKKLFHIKMWLGLIKSNEKSLIKVLILNGGLKRQIEA